MPAILSLLKAIPGPLEALRGTVESLDWSALLRDAYRHGVAGVIQFELDRAKIEPPEPARTVLRRQSLAVIATNVRLRRLLLKSVDALAQQGMIPIVLKGFGLAARIYPDPFIRATSDVDLLANREDFSRAQSAMEELGFRRMAEATGEKPGLDRHHPGHGGHHVTYLSAEGALELHWRPASAFSAPLSVDDAFTHCVDAHLEGRAVRYLRLEDEIVLLASHASKHLLGRLEWLYDLKLLLLKVTPDWELVVDLAQRTGLGAPVHFALQAARRALNAVVPAHVLSALRPPFWQRVMARWAFSDEHLVASPLDRHRYLGYALRLFLAGGVSNIAAGALSLTRQARQRLLGFYLPLWVRRTAQAIGLRAGIRGQPPPPARSRHQHSRG
jgi:hypothetical protein